MKPTCNELNIMKQLRNDIYTNLIYLKLMALPLRINEMIGRVKQYQRCKQWLQKALEYYCTTEH